MIINKKINELFTEEQKNLILDILLVNLKDLEFTFNENFLDEKGWFYGAIDDNSFDIEEVEKIINSTKDKVKQFTCINLEPLWKNVTLENLDTYVFENKYEDWMEILSPYNEYTLWNSAIFDYNFNIFIIKPWSIGYNLMIGGAENIIDEICNGKGWLINDKHPITPA